MDKATPRSAVLPRGRRPSIRKVVLQVPFDPAEVEAIRAYAAKTRLPMAEIVRGLAHGRLSWVDDLGCSIAAEASA